MTRSICCQTLFSEKKIAKKELTHFCFHFLRLSTTPNLIFLFLFDKQHGDTKQRIVVFFFQLWSNQNRQSCKDVQTFSFHPDLEGDICLKTLCDKMERWEAACLFFFFFWSDLKFQPFFVKLGLWVAIQS